MTFDNSSAVSLVSLTGRARSGVSRGRENALARSAVPLLMQRGSVRISMLFGACTSSHGLSSMESIQGKVVIVTGASGGIGRSTALALARRGATVVISGRNLGALDALAAEIRSMGAVATAIPADVTEEEQVARLVEDTHRLYGRVDCVVCNAGVYVRQPVRDLANDEIERCMAVNFYGAVALIKRVLPEMLRRRAGHIVVVSSVDGKKGLPPDGGYVASKFAITGYMDVLRQELRGSGVHASTILPGRVDTAMIAHLTVPWLSRKVPPGKVANAVIRALERKKAEIIVPYLGPEFLVLVNAISPRLGDWMVRVTGISGKEKEIVEDRAARVHPDRSTPAREVSERQGQFPNRRQHEARREG